MMSFFGKKNKKAKKSIEDLLKEEDHTKEELKNQETKKVDVLFEDTTLQLDQDIEKAKIDKEIEELKNDIINIDSKVDDLDRIHDDKENLEKFDFIKEGEKISISEESIESFIEKESLTRDLLDFSEEVEEEGIREGDILEEDIEEDNTLIGGDDYINVNQVEAIFDYLHEKCGEGFVSGFVYNNIEHKNVYNYNSKNSLFRIFADFFAELEKSVSRSEFEEQNEYYLLDLKENKHLFVLTYKIHHFVFVFDKTKVNVGYILYILKHNIDTMYRETQIQFNN